MFKSGDRGYHQLTDDIEQGDDNDTGLKPAVSHGSSKNTPLCGPICNSLLNKVMWGGIVTYAGLVSIMYAALSTQKIKVPVTWWNTAIASVAMNFPMSVLFADEFFEEFKRLQSAWRVNNYGYIAASIVALVLAGLCTLAGISIAYDTINKTNIDFVHDMQGFGVGLFSYNTFSTRWVGGIYLVLELSNKIKRHLGYMNDISEYHVFVQDCDRFVSSELDLRDPSTDLADEIQRVYIGVHKYYCPEKTMIALDACKLKLLCSLVLFYGAWQTLPMWFEKSRQGGIDFGGFMAATSVAWCGMAASLSFYLSSALQFVGDNVAFYNVMMYSISGGSKPGSAMRLLTYGATLSLIHYWAYESGEGMKIEATGLIKKGFSPEDQAYLQNPVVHYFLNPPIMIDNWYWIFNGISGNVVNGRSTTNFGRKMVAMTDKGRALAALKERVMAVLSRPDVNGEDADLVQSVKQAIRRGHQGLFSTEEDLLSSHIGSIGNTGSVPG